MEWRVEFDPAVERELGKIDPQIARRILAFLQDRLTHIENPRSVGKALKGSTLGEFRKYRVGDYQIIAHIENDALRILIVRIGRRRCVYRK